MKVLLRGLLSAVCIGILLFCCFGFAATFEPLDRSVQITWRVIYGLVAILAIAAVVFLNRSRIANDKPE